MRFRVFASAFLAVLCGSALYAQLPERVTFQPATFGHATHYGFYDARVGGSAKMTYANTNFAQRNSFRSGVVVRPYGQEPTKIVGYSQPEYRTRVAYPTRSGRTYVPINMYDCLCASGGMIETSQIPPRTTLETESGQTLNEKPVLPAFPKPEPVVVPPLPDSKDSGISLTPTLPQDFTPESLDELLDVIDDKVEEQVLPPTPDQPKKDDPFGPATVPGPAITTGDDDEDDFDLFGPATVPGPAITTGDDDEDDFDLFGPATVPGPANITTGDDDEDGFDLFGPATVPGPANITTGDDDEDDFDPFGDDDSSFDINGLFDTIDEEDDSDPFGPMPEPADNTVGHGEDDFDPFD